MYLFLPLSHSIRVHVYIWMLTLFSEKFEGKKQKEHQMQQQAQAGIIHCSVQVHVNVKS